MAGDYTRFTFDPFNDFASVLMQQGRVQLDADWNELVELIDRRLRAETIDTIGRATVPKETPDAFNITLSGGKMTIGVGRIYVDGLLAENHGTGKITFDPTLAEQEGSDPVDYASQPYFPSPDLLPTSGGPHLVYLDVWRREVTALEDPLIVEKAIGIDTTTRYQTVWQVKVLPKVGNISCDTPLDTIPGWTAANPPAQGRLTTTATGQPASSDPCVIPPNGGYRGIENRLYRLEVHDPGPLGTATFKWSRDNASVATAVTAISTGRDQLTVTQAAKDSVLRFNPGDWVEVTDDFLELKGQHGLIRKVAIVDAANQIITLTAALSAGQFPTSGAGNNTDATRHTRVRRWDQKGLVRDSNGNVVADVDAGLGVIKLAAVTPSFVLEDGVQVSLSADPAGGVFRTGDYWVFAARTADASVELLKNAPPRGIHHHYAKLALVTIPGTPSDCRHKWPPDVTGGGCDCSVCVTADSHNKGTLTIQQAIDQVKVNGGKVCLGPGVYNLGSTPVNIAGAKSVQIQGHGATTLLEYVGVGPAISVQSSFDITIDRIALLTFGSPNPDNLGDSDSIMLQNSIMVTIKNCVVMNPSTFLRSPEIPDGEGAAIGLVGVVVAAAIEDNYLFAGSGIASASPPLLRSVGKAKASYLFTLGLRIQDNYIGARDFGVLLDGLLLSAGETRIQGNTIVGCLQSAVQVTGFTFVQSSATPPGWPLQRVVVFSSHVDVESNTIVAMGAGVTVGCDQTRVQGNDISALFSGPGGSGIVLATGLAQDGIDDCQIIGNTISGVGGDGISIQTIVKSAMIKQNYIEDVAGGGIIMYPSTGGDWISIENNQLVQIAPQAQRNTFVIGIALNSVSKAHISANSIDGVGMGGNMPAFGIVSYESPSVRITDNEVSNIAPDKFVDSSAGIWLISPFDRAEVVCNTVRRRDGIINTDTVSKWLALQIGQLPVGIVSGQFQSWRAPLFHSIFLSPPTGSISARGNHFEGVATDQLVFCNADGMVAFDSNRCVLTGQSTGLALQETFGKANRAARAFLPLVDIAGAAVIVSSNFVRSSSFFVGINIRQPQNPAFTAVGNITSGGITVNATPLAAPWDPLNIVMP